jgi:hypothetical protein
MHYLSRSAWGSAAAVLMALGCATTTIEGRANRKTYSTTIPMSSDAAEINGLCISFTASMTSDWFNGLERVETSSEVKFRRRKNTVTNFPDVVDIQVWARPYECKSVPWKPQPKGLGAETLDSLSFELFWKHNLELRAASLVFSVKKAYPSARMWFFLIEARSADIPLNDHLVLSILTQDGTKIARLSCRL